VEARFAEFQQKIVAQNSTQSSTLDKLENQVVILNKATGRIHRRQVAIAGPATEIAGEFNSLKSNAQTCLTNLEKAIKQMHQRQRSLMSQNTSDNSQDTSDSASSLRLTNLEKAVKNLHLRSTSKEAANNSLANAQLDAQMNELMNASVAADMVARMDVLEQRVESASQDQSQWLSRMENSPSRLRSNQPQSALLARTTQSDIKRRVETDLRLMRLERQVARLENQYETVHGNTQQQEVVVDQLIQMRSYIDTLISEMYR
jgi:hypothetical protein